MSNNLSRRNVRVRRMRRVHGDRRRTAAARLTTITRRLQRRAKELAR